MENQEYQNLGNKVYKRRKTISKLMDEGGPKHPGIGKIKAEIKELDGQRFNMPSVLTMDEGYKRLRYCRYADDFVIGIIGSRMETEAIAAKVEEFLTDNLLLEVAKDKTQLSHAQKGINYLSYGVRTVNSNRVVKAKRGKFLVSTRSLRGQIQLGIPTNKIESFCEGHGYGRYKSHQWTHILYLINRTELEILMVYNAQLRGFANYYCLAGNVKTRLHKLRNIWLGSLLDTFACKRKSSYKKLYSFYKEKGWQIEYKGKKGMHVIRFFNLNQIANPKDRIDVKPTMYSITRSRSDILDRFNAEKCEYCGREDGYFEVHHVRKLSSLKPQEEWQRLMISIRRKTLVLCIECHDKLHSGTLPSKRKVT